jgi:hypothetical protein
LPLRLDTEMPPHFRNRCFPLPAPDEPGDDLRWRAARSVQSKAWVAKRSSGSRKRAGGAAPDWRRGRTILPRGHPRD